MPVCIGCGASYDESEKLCPYCGRYKPEAQKVEIKVNVTEEAGKLTCPSCHRADKAQKVSAIIAGQTHSIGVQTDKKTTTGAQMSVLAQRLSVTPEKPQQVSGVGKWKAWGYILLFIGGMGIFFLLIMPVTGGPSLEITGSSIPGFLFFGVLGFMALGVAKGRQVKVDEANKKLKQWQVAMKRHEELFYCAGCDCVYIPEKGSFAPVQQMKEYLKSVA